MTINQINGIGNISKPLYYYTVRFVYEDTRCGVFSFVSNKFISRNSSRELGKFIYESSSDTGAYRGIFVTGNFVDKLSEVPNKTMCVRYVSSNNTGSVINLVVYYYNNVNETVNTSTVSIAGFTFYNECYTIGGV